MVEAMNAMKSGRLGVNRATEEYTVSRTTLKDTYIDYNMKGKA